VFETREIGQHYWDTVVDRGLGRRSIHVASLACCSYMSASWTHLTIQCTSTRKDMSASWTHLTIQCTSTRKDKLNYSQLIWQLRAC